METSLELVNPCYILKFMGIKFMHRITFFLNLRVLHFIFKKKNEPAKKIELTPSPTVR